MEGLEGFYLLILSTSFSARITVDFILSNKENPYGLSTSQQKPFWIHDLYGQNCSLSVFSF